MTPEAAARIVEQRGAEFVRQLRQVDDDFRDTAFGPAVADALRTAPELVERWTNWSSDQRWTPSAYVEATETGWFDGTRQHVRMHADAAGAVADFIGRMAAWSARREVITVAGRCEKVSPPPRP